MIELRTSGPRAAASRATTPSASGRRDGIRATGTRIRSGDDDAPLPSGSALRTDGSAADGVVVDVAVVGAGIAGLSLADAVVRRGRSVRVFEAGTIGDRGASSLPLALLNPHRGRSARAHPDDLEGLAAFWRRDARLRADGFDPGAERSGVLRIAASEAQAERWRDLAAGVDTAVWLDAHDVPAGVRAPHGALRVPDGGWVDPPRLLAALARSATAHGATIVERTRVVGLARVEDGRPPTESLPSDGTWKARSVVLCVGAEIEPDLPIPDLARLEGDVITLAPVDPLPHPIAGGVYGGTRPDPADGGSPVAMVGGNHRSSSTGAAPEADPGLPAIARALRNRFARLAPDVADADVVAHWRGVRAKRPGHRPWVVERAPDVWFFGAFAGRGFLCAAAEAERLAERLDRPRRSGADGSSGPVSG